LSSQGCTSGISLPAMRSCPRRCSTESSTKVLTLYANAWTLLPGKVHAEGLSIRSSDSGVAWILRIDKVTFSVALWALTQRRFEVSEVEAGETSMRIRQRLAEAPISPSDYQDLPPIEGFAPYAVREPKSAADLAEYHFDDTYRLWTVVIRNVVVHSVRELWLNGVRFEGDASIQGGFMLKPLRRVEVFPATWQLRAGSVHVGAQEVATTLVGAGTFRLAAFDPRPSDYASIIHLVDLDANAAAEIPHIDALHLPLPEGLKLRGQAQLSNLVAHVRQGLLVEPSQLTLGAPSLEIRFGPHRLQGILRAELAVAVPKQTTVEPLLTFRGELSDLHLAHGLEQGSALPIGSASRAHLYADARALDLAAPFSDLHTIIDIPSSAVPDVRALNGYLATPTSMYVHGGAAQVAAHLETWFLTHLSTGNGEFHGEQLDLQFAGVRARGVASGTLRFDNYDDIARTATNVVLNAGIARGTLVSARSRALLEVKGVTVSAQAETLSVDAPLATLSSKVHVDEVRVLDPTFFESSKRAPRSTSIRAERMRFALDCDLAIARHRARGSLTARSLDLWLRYGKFALSAEIGASASIHDWDFEHNGLVLDHAQITVERLRVWPIDTALAAMEIRSVVLSAQSKRFLFSDPLAALDFSAAVEGGTLHDAEAVNTLLPGALAVQLDTDEGTFAGTLVGRMTNGVFDGKLGAKAHALGIRRDGFHLLGDVEAHAEVEHFDSEKKTVVIRAAEVHVANARGRVRESDAFFSDRLDVHASAPFFDIMNPSLRNVELSVDIGPTGIPDARAFRDLLGPLQLEGGSATLQGQIRLSAARQAADAKIDVTIKAAKATFGHMAA
jgi:hypothetical protein